MNTFMNKLLMKWREPNFTLKHIKKHLSWSDWLRPFLRIFLKSILFMFAFFTVTYLIHGNLHPFSFEAIAISIGVSIIFCLLVWILSVIPVEIHILEKGILRYKAVGSMLIPYKEVQSCAIRQVELDGQKFEVLKIKFWNGQESGFEIAPSVSGDAVTEKLSEMGVQITPRKQLHS